MNAYDGPAWSRHFQGPWEERAGDPRLPLWTRVASLAFGKHRANGHASFGKGDVALTLTTVDRDTGVMKRPDAANVRRAIRLASEYGWLSSESRSTCLVVPEWAISGGLGTANAPCRNH